jgi:hypothetical protein
MSLECWSCHVGIQDAQERVAGAQLSSPCQALHVGTLQQPPQFKINAMTSGMTVPLWHIETKKMSTMRL